MPSQGDYSSNSRTFCFSDDNFMGKTSDDTRSMILAVLLRGPTRRLIKPRSD